MNDERLIAERLLGLAEYFGKELSPATLDVYLEAFQAYDDRDIVNACTYVVKTLKFFPRVADFVEIIEGDPESKSAVAWRTLIKAIEDHGGYYSVRFDDGAIMAAVEAMGGWIQLCGLTYTDLKFRQKEFDSLYRQFLRRRDSYPDKLVGFFEADNRSKGYLDNIQVPRRVTSIGERSSLRLAPERVDADSQSEAGNALSPSRIDVGASTTKTWTKPFAGSVERLGTKGKRFPARVAGKDG